MDPLPLSQLAEFANGSLEGGDANLTVSRISTDSRTIQAGDLFVPIRGENFDGHQFVRQTAERGAVGALVDESWREEVPQNFALIRVPDTLVGY
ncbi:MAG: Mur ligase domain-containing protein, partial [Chthoniobacterales bacterium]